MSTPIRLLTRFVSRQVDRFPGEEHLRQTNLSMASKINFENTKLKYSMSDNRTLCEIKYVI